MGIGSSSHRYPSCTRHNSCLMMKMVMGAWWKWGIHHRWSNPTFSTPCNHFCGSNMITGPSTFCFIKLFVAMCGNISLSVRSQYSNFMVGTRLRGGPSNIMSSGRSKVWSALFMASQSFATLTFPFYKGMYIDNFVAEGIGGTSSSSSSRASIWSISTCKCSSSSSNSTVMDFPFSFIDNLSNHGFLGDMQIGPIVYLSFFGRGVHGDFETSSARATSLISSWTIWGFVASPTISSMNHTLGPVLFIVFTQDMVWCILKGGKSGRCSILCNYSNLKQQSVVSWLALGFYSIFFIWIRPFPPLISH